MSLSTKGTEASKRSDASRDGVRAATVCGEEEASSRCVRCERSTETGMRTPDGVVMTSWRSWEGIVAVALGRRRKRRKRPAVIKEERGNERRWRWRDTAAAGTDVVGVRMMAEVDDGERRRIVTGCEWIDQWINWINWINEWMDRRTGANR